MEELNHKYIIHAKRQEPQSKDISYYLLAPLIWSTNDINLHC